MCWHDVGIYNCCIGYLLQQCTSCIESLGVVRWAASMHCPTCSDCLYVCDVCAAALGPRNSAAVSPASRCWTSLHICLHIHVSSAGHRRIPAASPSLQPAATAPQLCNPQQQPAQPTTSPFQAAAMARAGSTTLESRSRQGSGALQTAGSRGGGSGTLSVGRQASGGVQGAGRQGSGAVESGPHQMPSEEEDVFLTPDLPARAVKK